MSVESFNVLTDPWIPLEERGKIHFASYLDLLTGEVDSEDLIHPRDDLRFYARMLLSALTQALFPPKDVKELRKRIEEPLSRRKAAERIEEVKEDFDLLGKRPFMQERLPEKGENETSRLFLDIPSGSRHLLFRTHRYDRICLSCAVPSLYGAQAFAPRGGRGKSPGVRGDPPVTTLVNAGSIRETMWANVLAAPRASEYPREAERPWIQKELGMAGDSIGLLTGLFWQPRRLWFADAGPGVCAACGATAELLSVRAFKAKSKVKGGFFAHPHTPYWQWAKARSGRMRRPAYLRADRPAWIGLADMLPAVGGNENSEGSRPAPVVSQWFDDLEERDVSMLVFAYATSKGAKIDGRFNETMAISIQKGPELLAEVRAMVDAAASCASALRDGLCRAHGPRRKGPGNRKHKGGFWASDAASAFWQGTEIPFWAALEQAERNEDWTEALFSSLRRTAISLFEAHTETSSMDNMRQELIAQAQRQMITKLSSILKRGEKHAA